MIEKTLPLHEDDGPNDGFVTVEFQDGMVAVERYYLYGEEDIEHDMVRVRLSLDTWTEIFDAMCELAKQEKVDE